MAIITEEMRFRKRLCEFAIKHGVTYAARRYKVNRQFVYRQLKKYDGTLKSLALKSTRPNSHPNQHSNEELFLIKKVNSRYKIDGRAEVFVQLKIRGYSRSFGSMCKQLRSMGDKPVRPKRTSHRKYTEVRGKFPGDKVQVDIKYVPMACINFDSHGKRYYQITSIDEYSRKRVLKIVDEKSVTHTSNFILELEDLMGFEINTIQTDNGGEFVNSHLETEKLTIFEKTLIELNIEHKRTAPYSPWQNGKVERSHREDNKFYERMEFKSEKDMIKKVKRYNSRYNNVHRQVLDFQSPNKVIEQYLSE